MERHPGAFSFKQILGLSKFLDPFFKARFQSAYRAWGVFAWVFLRIDRVFLRISSRFGTRAPTRYWEGTPGNLKKKIQKLRQSDNLSKTKSLWKAVGASVKKELAIAYKCSII